MNWTFGFLGDSLPSTLALHDSYLPRQLVWQCGVWAKCVLSLSWQLEIALSLMLFFMVHSWVYLSAFVQQSTRITLALLASPCYSCGCRYHITGRTFTLGLTAHDFGYSHATFRDDFLTYANICLFPFIGWSFDCSQTFSKGCSVLMVDKGIIGTISLGER